MISKHKILSKRRTICERWAVLRAHSMIVNCCGLYNPSCWVEQFAHNDSVTAMHLPHTTSLQLWQHLADLFCEQLAAISLLRVRCSIPSDAWNLWQIVRLWSTRNHTVHVLQSKFSSQFADEVYSWNFLVRSRFVQNESIDTGQIQDVVKNSNRPPTGTRFHRVQPSHLVGSVYNHI